MGVTVKDRLEESITEAASNPVTNSNPGPQQTTSQVLDEDRWKHAADEEFFGLAEPVKNTDRSLQRRHQPLEGVDRARADEKARNHKEAFGDLMFVYRQNVLYWRGYLVQAPFERVSQRPSQTARVCEGGGL